MTTQIGNMFTNLFFNMVHKLIILYYIETLARIMDQGNEEIVRTIESLCDEILLIPIMNSLQIPRSTVSNIRKQNQEFIRDLEGIAQSTKTMKSIKQKVIKLDKQLEKLDRILQKLQQQQSQQWKWYHYVTEPIWYNIMTVWSCVKDICSGLLKLIRNYQDIFYDSKEIYLQKKEKILVEKEKCQQQAKRHENAIDRLRLKINDYVRQKGNKYQTFLRHMSFQFNRLKPQPRKQNTLTSSRYNTSCSELQIIEQQ